MTKETALQRIFEAEREQRATLDLSRLSLATVPPEIGRLTQLQSLDLRSNKLTTLPRQMGQLKTLQALNLRSNKLIRLPRQMGQLTQLQSLDLRSNELSEFPQWLRQLVALESLKLYSNNLTYLPEWIGELTQLRLLDLGDNYQFTLPTRMKEMTRLQSLNLCLNDLTALPDWMGELTQLQWLDLRSNRLSELPGWMGQLTQLRLLDLSSNRLIEVPEWIGRLKMLRSLDLSSNGLVELPGRMGEMMKLQTLDLSSNKLRKLPEWVGQLPELQNLYVTANPCVVPPDEVLDGALGPGHKQVNLHALRDYFRQLNEEGESYLYEAKMLLIGEGGVGKSSLAVKLHDVDAALPEPGDSTEGIEISRWSFPVPRHLPKAESEACYAHIWDFGGQEIYYATHQFFLTRRSIYVLLADTRQQHTRFYYWLKVQEAFGGSSPVVLVKNLNRRHGQDFQIGNLGKLRDRFSNLQEIIEVDLAKVPTTDGWSKLLRTLQRRFLSFDHIGQPTPATWVRVRTTLADDSRDTIPYRDYLALCRAKGIERDGDALQLSDYLHNLGDILHFQKDDLLQDTVILNPEWGLDAVYRALDNEAIRRAGGRFALRDLKQLWHEPKYDGFHIQLLQLMKNFQLCYELEENHHYIAPQLLPIEKPEYKWDTTDNLQIRFRYPDFMPFGLLSRIIVRLHRRIADQRLVWRTGAVFKDDFARAEVLELRKAETGEIRIRVSGSVKGELLMEIVRELEDMHDNLPKLRYQKRIPCNCVNCKESTEPHFFDLDKLHQRLQLRRDTIECQAPPTFEMVNVQNLLNDHWPVSTRDGGIHHHHYGDSYDIGEVRSQSTVIGRDAKSTNARE